MTSCQAFYCTNEKGKCEMIFFVITDHWPLSTHRTATTKKTGKYDSIGDKKDKKACVRIKRVKSDSYLTYDQSPKTWNYTIIRRHNPPSVHQYCHENHNKYQNNRTAYSLTMAHSILGYVFQNKIIYGCSFQQEILLKGEWNTNFSSTNKTESRFCFLWIIESNLARRKRTVWKSFWSEVLVLVKFHVSFYFCESVFLSRLWELKHHIETVC